MATEILATGTSDAASSDVTVASGSQLTVALKGASPPTAGSLVEVQIKDDGGAYVMIDQLTQQRPALVVSAGVYRFVRHGGVSCGVFSA